MLIRARALMCVYMLVGHVDGKRCAHYGEMIIMGCCPSVLLTPHRFAEIGRRNECSKPISLCNHVTYVIVIRMLRDVCLFVNSVGCMASSDSPQQYESD